MRRHPVLLRRALSCYFRSEQLEDIEGPDAQSACFGTCPFPARNLPPRSAVAPKQVLMVSRDTAFSRATGTLRKRAGATALRSLICTSPPGRRPSSDRQALPQPFGRNAQCCHIIYRVTIFHGKSYRSTTKGDIDRQIYRETINRPVQAHNASGDHFVAPTSADASRAGCSQNQLCLWEDVR
jgi:hypothetical protein